MQISHATPGKGHAALGWLLGCAVLLSPIAATAQSVLRPAQPPQVTAEHERWYLEGQAISFWGNLYYPAGAAVFFNPYEMVRSGDYRGIPLYSIKTREPYAVVYVPLTGGMLQPYERRRDGDLAGTVGSVAPSFPVVRDSEATGRDSMLQAPGPPALRDFRPIYSYGGPHAGFISGPVAPDFAEPATLSPPPLGSLSTALEPVGLNAFYIDYKGRRWFSSGPTVLLDPTFSNVGDYFGFPVYVSRDRPAETIYIPVAAETKRLVTPYSIEK